MMANEIESNEQNVSDLSTSIVICKKNCMEQFAELRPLQWPCLLAWAMDVLKIFINLTWWYLWYGTWFVPKEIDTQR